MSKYQIGDVSVIKGDPPNGNPYRGVSLSGNERADALMDFRNDVPQPELTFWYTPCFGGAKPCAQDDVDWESSGVSVGKWVDDRDGFKCQKCGKWVWKNDRKKCKCDKW